MPSSPLYPHQTGAWRRSARAAALALGLATVCAMGTIVQAQAQTPAGDAQRIQPRDGHWRWDVGTAQASESCVPGIADTLRQLLPQERGEDMRFEQPFHPQQLIEHALVRWEQRTPNHFIATATGATVQGFPLPMNVRYELHVLSPTQMRGHGSVQMNVWQPCSVSAPFDFRLAPESDAASTQAPPFMPPPKSSAPR